MKITYLSSECSRGTMRKKSSLDILNSGVVVVGRRRSGLERKGKCVTAKVHSGSWGQSFYS